jgi:HlyD family secretion protein
MKNFLIKIKTYVFAHKFISTIVIVVVLGLGYWGYQKINTPASVARYVTAKVTTGTIISSITDSGQVSASNQINITPQASGILTEVKVKPGDSVGTGQTLFAIDDTSAAQAVRDAKIGVQNANLALQKLQLQNSTIDLNTSLAQAYDNGFTAVSNTFLDLPNIQNGLTNMFFTSNPQVINGQFYVNWYAAQAGATDQEAAQVYEQTLKDSYNTALTAYNKNISDYKSISRNSDNATIDTFIAETYNTTKLLADVIKNANDYIDFVNSSMQANNFNIPTIIATHKALLNTYTAEINSHLSDLLSAQASISTNKDAFPSSDLSTQSAQIAIQQANNTLLDAEQNLAKCYVTAPFGGIIASVPVITGDNVSSGTTLATIITSRDLATVTLSEVDVAKISLGDKATLTFNAIPNLTIAGQVVEIDSVGTVSQGVVNYNVQISFDATNDGGVKPGMSVNADIITDMKQNVLMVPNSAIKTVSGVSYVQTFATPLVAALPGVQGSPSTIAPISQVVATGISNATSTEIVSGLNDGDIIVTKTVNSTTAAATTSTTPSILGGVGSTGRVGGGAVRIGG